MNKKAVRTFHDEDTHVVVYSEFLPLGGWDISSVARIS
jgi:hypothetical protein